LYSVECSKGLECPLFISTHHLFKKITSLWVCFLCY
jgi:hypothetical protein